MDYVLFTVFTSYVTYQCPVSSTRLTLSPTLHTHTTSPCIKSLLHIKISESRRTTGTYFGKCRSSLLTIRLPRALVSVAPSPPSCPRLPRTLASLVQLPRDTGRKGDGRRNFVVYETALHLFCPDLTSTVCGGGLYHGPMDPFPTSVPS